MAQRYTIVGGLRTRKEPSWKTYINKYEGTIVYSGQPFVYKGKTRIVPRGALYLPEYDDMPAVLVLARNGEAIDINSIPMADSDQTPNKAKKSLRSATQMLDRAQKTGYQDENKPSGLKLATDGVFGGVKALGAGLLGTLATGSTLPLLAGGLYGAKKVIGGALGGLGGIMKGIGNVTGITPAVGKAWGGLKSKVGMGGPTKAERAGPLTNDQFINFEEKLFGYVDKEIDRDKRRLERMKRQSEYDEEAADESRGGERPGTPVRDGGSEKKPMSGLMKGLMVLGGIVALGAAITAIVVYKDELLKIWDEYGLALKAGAAIITGLAIAGSGASLLDMLPGGGKKKPPVGGAGGSNPPEMDKNGKPVRERHPKGAKNAAGKSIGGQFKSVEKGAVKDIIKSSIAKRAGKVIGKSIPLIGFALGAYDTVSRLIQKDHVGAAIAASSAAASFIPVVGTAVSFAGAAANMIRDVYNDVYGVYPEKDDSGEVKERMEEIAQDTWAALGVKPGIKGVPALVLEYGKALKSGNSQQKKRAGAALRTKLAGEKYSDEEIKAILGDAGAAARGKGNVDDLAASLAASKVESDADASSTDSTSSDSTGDGGKERAVADSATVAAPPPGDSVVDTQSQQGQPEVGAPPKPDSATIDAKVSASADKAVITLPAKVLEGPPIIMPSPETGQGSSPGEIQTRPNDRTLNSASSNLNASRQMAYT